MGNLDRSLIRQLALTNARIFSTRRGVFPAAVMYKKLIYYHNTELKNIALTRCLLLLIFIVNTKYSLNGKKT